MLASFCKRLHCPSIYGPKAIIFIGLAIVVSGLSGLGIGYQIAVKEPAPGVTAQIESLNALLKTEQETLDEARSKAEDDIDAVAMRLGALQAQMTRLDAVGERLVELAGLDEDEFVFGTEPGVGSATKGESGETQSALELVTGLNQFEELLKEREHQLTLIEEIIMTRDLSKEMLPSGLPVKVGYVSSGFGSRIHPISGKRKMHEGVDIPGKAGSDVVAVASGVVLSAKRMSGYGNVVEIRHPNGITTRYAHNKQNLVEEGEIVKKGDVIALLGSTGLSTSPHVHFEVRKNGAPINPKSFINAAK